MGLQEGADGPKLVAESPVRWRLEQRGDMRVPGVIFASERLLPDVHGDHSLEQVANVATLPGIEGASYAMPGVHWGYGFPIGGVAATDVAGGGVVSPGGVGFDISCGVRLLTAPFDERELQPPLPAPMDVLAAVIPRGMDQGAVWQVADRYSWSGSWPTARSTRSPKDMTSSRIWSGVRTADGSRARTPGRCA
jgi:tRNA-splicing ligase RtcB (3'-phosphate/5'-hydroxy nucleic acid ligase)